MERPRHLSHWGRGQGSFFFLAGHEYLIRLRLVSKVRNISIESCAVDNPRQCLSSLTCRAAGAPDNLSLGTVELGRTLRQSVGRRHDGW